MTDLMMLPPRRLTFPKQEIAMLRITAIVALLFSLACSGESSEDALPGDKVDAGTTAGDTGFGSSDIGGDTGDSDAATDSGGDEDATTDAGTDEDADTTGDTATDDTQETDDGGVDDPCVPTTCATANAECGFVEDGCGETINCGNCDAPNTCAGAGQDNQCGCTPLCEGKICGQKDNCNDTCEDGSGCCTDACTPIGTVECGADGDSIVTCVNLDNDPCLEWTDPQTCNGGGCTDGECSECTPVCTGKMCGQSDGCGKTCDAGSGCCVDECTAAGDKKCSGESKLMICGEHDGDLCLEWSAPQSCPSGVCENNKCKEEEIKGPNCVDPQEVIAGPGATGSGVCDFNNLLENDGKAAEFWSKGDTSWDSLEVPITACKVLDFGKLCSPKKICVKAWGGQNGCSGDGCDGKCEKCKGYNAAVDIFAHTKNSTLSFQYQFSVYGNESSNPGKVMCYPAKGNVRYVLLCRPYCPINNAKSYNMFVDYVWLEN
jgi:hypothetical protein